MALGSRGVGHRDHPAGHLDCRSKPEELDREGCSIVVGLGGRPTPAWKASAYCSALPMSSLLGEQAMVPTPPSVLEA